MQQEKKGLFGRLLDFWKEKTEEAGGGIGFWSGGKTEGKTTAENRQDALPIYNFDFNPVCPDSTFTRFPAGRLGSWISWVGDGTF